MEDPRESNDEPMFAYGRRVIEYPELTTVNMTRGDGLEVEGQSIKTHKIYTSEIGQKVLVTDKLVRDAHRDELLKIVQRQALHAFVRYLTVNGKRVCGPTQLETERDASLRATEVVQVIEVIDDNRVAALLARSEQQLQNLKEAVNQMSLWRLLWTKLRGRPVVKEEFRD